MIDDYGRYNAEESGGLCKNCIICDNAIMVGLFASTNEGLLCDECKERLKKLLYDPQGHWEKTDVATYRCSECGKIQIADDVNELNFCCCCGSRNKIRRKGEEKWQDLSK